MNDTKTDSRPAGIGTGYLSLMMIFVTLCLTALAALSLSAAENEKSFSVNRFGRERIPGLHGLHAAR